MPEMLAMNLHPVRGRRRVREGSVVAPAVAVVAANGWEAAMVTPIDLALAPVALSRQGYNATGGTVTVAETVLTTKRVRQPYPNEGSLTANTVALSDYVYTTDTISGVTNNSTEISPKPVANWSIVDRRVVGNSLYLEIVAFHRNGVACVEFSATDGTLTVSATTSAPIVSAVGGDAGAVIVYAVTLDITTLADAANITANAKVYPRIGAAASVADSALSSVAREFSPRVWRKNVARAASPNLVYLASGGNDTTGYVGTDAGLAAASPCQTLTGAINRARTVLGTSAGSLDGLRVRLTAGTWTLATIPTANTVNAEVVIEPAPGVAKADALLGWGTANTRFGLNYVRFLGITIDRTGAVGNLFGSTSGFFAVVDGCNINMNGVAGAWGTTAGSAGYFIGGTVISGALSTGLSAGTAEVRMLRGVSGGVANDGAQVEGWLVLGSALQGIRFTWGTRATSGLVLAYNLLTRLGGTNAVAQIESSVDNLTGAAVVQNVWEWTSATSGPVCRPSGDSAPNDTSHLICWHNTFAGFDIYGRGNILYNETASDARTHKLHSFIGNVHVQMNTKHDVFAADGSRVGGWSFLYGVGARGEFARYRDAGSGAWSREYSGAGSITGTINTGVGTDPRFISPAHTTSGPLAGAGGGNYVLEGGSPARGIVFASPLPFDMAGSARSGSVAAGAFL
jgi:hypothetical protein